MPYQYVDKATGLLKAGRDPANIYYPTLADMRAFMPPLTNGIALCTLLGSTTIFDGTYGEYGWNNASSTADNGTTVIKPTDAGATGRWIRFRA